MITQATIAEKIIAHLNGELTESELVHWAEDTVVIITESDADIPNEDTILDIVMYLGAGDTPGFPLTWTVLSDFLHQLGTRVRVVTEAA